MFRAHPSHLQTRREHPLPRDEESLLEALLLAQVVPHLLDRLLLHQQFPPLRQLVTPLERQIHFLHTKQIHHPQFHPQPHHSALLIVPGPRPLVQEAESRMQGRGARVVRRFGLWK